MWKPRLDFLVLHYIYIISCSALVFILFVARGNVPAVDSLFFGASACTESGLNTVDVMELDVYQQVVIYVFATITNLGFVSIAVVVFRLHWFRKRLSYLANNGLVNRNDIIAPPPAAGPIKKLEEYTTKEGDNTDDQDNNIKTKEPCTKKEGERQVDEEQYGVKGNETTTSETAVDSHPQPLAVHDGERGEAEPDKTKQQYVEGSTSGSARNPTTLTFAPDVRSRNNPDDVLIVNGPRERREEGRDSLEIRQAKDYSAYGFPLSKRDTENTGGRGGDHKELGLRRMMSRSRTLSFSEPRRNQVDALPKLSTQATLGRNSSFHHLSAPDREALGGAEYKALKLLLKVALSYFFGLHLFGVICLVPWIHLSPDKYTDYLQETGQDRTWWALFSAATMTNNLGFTLTPDSMIMFRDATWPMLVMTFLAFFGFTLYPVGLRLSLWTMHKLTPASSPRQEALHFLLKHPRRCYFLLFPSQPTWILFGIIVILSAVDTLFIIVLDLDNPEVNELPLGPRVLAALFQSASARHTGTATFSLGEVNPAVQFSLLAMMYIAVFPIAMSVRASNTYEEKALGLFDDEDTYDESSGKNYIKSHIRNQLSFDLWYIFIGVFAITIAESSKIMDESLPSFNLFAIMFEVTSAYGNVGLSLGHPDVMTSFAGKTTTFSKVVLCAMMIRGRHRMLPSKIDRAIMLPTELQGSDIES